MAENESGQGQEKTEEPTPKRLQDAKKKGQVPRSRELNTTLVLVAGATALMTLGSGMGTDLVKMVKEQLVFDRNRAFDPSATTDMLAEGLWAGLAVMAPFLFVVFIAALVAPLLIGGWSFSTKAMAPKFERMNPIKGMKKIFSLRGLVELVKAVLKVLLVGGIATVLIWNLFPELMQLGSQTVGMAIRNADAILVWSFFAISASLILIAAIDAPFQMFQHRKQLKMTMQEVKDERKDTEGDPEVKGRIRQLQQQAAQARMMEAVPEADVIVTNPTHFAVALKYDSEKMAAPVVVAKGMDLIAARIREIAQENDVPLFEAPPLARALYRNTDINDEIPAALYLAVAQVLAYVFQLQAAISTGNEAPTHPGDIDIPDEFRSDDITPDDTPQ